MEPSPPVQGPTRRKVNRWLALTIAVVAALVVLALAIQVGIPAAQRAAARPEIAINHVVVQSSRGHHTNSPYLVTFFNVSFNLTNTGNADGFADVVFRVSSSSNSSSRCTGNNCNVTFVISLDVENSTYFVPARATVSKWQHLQAFDGDHYGISVNLVASRKG